MRGRKRIKQYLMLLLVAGVIAVIASGGGGTFASFNAETQNNGNTFATGTLILNNTHGSTTCTSAFNTGGTANQNTAGTNCATLFNNVTFTPVHAVADGTSGQSQISVTSITGTIYNGDTLTIKPTSGSPINTTATNTTPLTAPGTLTIAATLGASFTGATVLDTSPTAFADLTLQNVGTINANDIVLTPSGCNSSYGGGNTTLNMGTVTSGTSSGTTLTVADTTGFVVGDPVIVSEGGDANTFRIAAIPSGTTITVVAQNWNHAYDTSAVVSGPRFNGPSANNICGNLRMSIVEESATPFDPLFANAVTNGCVYGVGTGNPAASNACDLSQGTLLTSTTATTLTNGGLNAGASRFFELAVHVNGASFDNTFQNTKTSSFTLNWHIDQ